MGKLTETEWQSYASEVLPRDASLVQRTECRRAFFAGAQAVFAAMFHGATTENAAAELYNQLREELAEYATQIGTPAEEAASTPRAQKRAPFEVDVTEDSKRGEVVVAITWRSYRRRELEPPRVAFFVARVCEEVARLTRENIHKITRLPLGRGGDA